MINVYPAQIEDSQTILSLWKQSGKWLQTLGINQWNPDTFTIDEIIHYFNNADAELFLAKVDGRIAGTFIILRRDPEVWQELDSPDAGYIHKFTTKREFKGQHLGNTLMNWIDGYIRSKGKQYVRLDCMADNVRLNQYYQDLGFRFIRTKEDWGINLFEKQLTDIKYIK